MSWKKKKVYGEYKVAACAFCGKVATQETDSGLQVCQAHRESKLDEIKCTCGSWLEQKAGKFGPYFNCINCGNFNFTKAMQIKELTMKDMLKPAPVEAKQEVQGSTRDYRKYEKKEPREITISSNDVEYFD